MPCTVQVALHIIRISEGKYLDCYQYRRSCKMSNDCRGLRHRTNGSSESSNCKVVVDVRQNRVRLETIRNVPPNTEMLWNYGDEYEMIVHY